jgi:diguanylate cyclase (GGDEF)-like protein
MSSAIDNKLLFDPYAQIIQALLPRVGGITAFDLEGHIRWTSESTVMPSLAVLATKAAATAEQSGEAGERVQLDNEPVYLFWLRDQQAHIKSILAISWRAGEVEQRTYVYVHSMIKPVLECMQREMVLRDEAAVGATSASMKSTSEESADSGDANLAMLLATSVNLPGDNSNEGVQHLLRSSIQHLQCDLAVVIMPERHLVILSKAEGQDVDTKIVAQVHRHLVSLAQTRNETAILNSPQALPGISLNYRVLSSPIRTPAGRSCGVLALFRRRDQAEFRRSDAQLAELLARRAATIVDANFDVLTGLFVRSAFEQRARVQMERRVPSAKSPWTALYLDADRIHVLNDNHGMHVGDTFLAKLGELIRARLVPGALCARISGDRFAILLPSGAEDAGAFAESLRLGVQSLTGAHLGITSENSFVLSVSIGLAAVVDMPDALPHTLALAETACKAAKDRGRNRVEQYQSSDVSIMQRFEDINIAPSLRAAMADNRMRLVSQLLAPLPGSENKIPHFELLLRMIDLRGETIGPDRFMSAAIRYQLMPEVDRWVISEAVRQLAPYAADLASRPVVFSINISGQSLGDASFVDFIIEQIRASGLNPAVFCFEITETTAIANLERAEVMMKRLRSLGCSIALDDFGTGLSSLAYLRALPIDMLKIDGSFVRDILKDPRAESMVRAIAQLARSMNLATVAEYVETDEIRLRVATLGVDYGQGFAIARPVPLAETIQDLSMLASVEAKPAAEVNDAGLAAQADDSPAPQNDESLASEIHDQLFGAGDAAFADDDTEARIKSLLMRYEEIESKAKKLPRAHV